MILSNSPLTYMRKKKNEQVGFVRFSRRTDVSSSSVLFSFALPFSSINSRSQGAGFAAVMMMSLGLFKIDDLPGQVVIEILCRLPLRSAFQCKCVSKGWYKLISDLSFRVRFLCLQGEKKTPTISRMIFQGRYKSLSVSWEDSLISREAMFFLSNGTLEERHEKCMVVATYNDFVLCYWPNEEDEPLYDLTIWNPYINQRVALPRPLCKKYATTTEEGIICEPYYSHKEQIGGNSNMVVNVEYKCRVVRISVFPDSTYLSITIYFPEVGEWREFDVPLPQMGRLYSYNKHAGIAYCGKLYWLVQGFIVELDALALDISTSSEDVAAKYCCFIEIVLDKQFDRRIMCLGLCRGSMRAMSIDSDHIRDGDHIRSWELRLGDDDDHHHHEQWGKWRFVHRASASLLISEKITSTYNGYVEVDNASENVLLCLDSLDEDTVYMLRKNGEVCRYNVLTGECDYISLGGPYSMFGVRMDPITHPWWPTPLPRVSSPRPFAF